MHLPVLECFEYRSIAVLFYFISFEIMPMFLFGSTYTPLIDVYGVGVRLNSFLFIYMHALFSFHLFRLVLLMGC